MAGGEPLSALDSLFLHLESPATPMHTGSVAIFEGAPLRDRRGALRMADLRDEISERLFMVPKLRRRVRFPAGPWATPQWVDDAAFDVSFHVRQVTLAPPGSEAQLNELSAALMSVPLDRAHPLWQLWLVDGLAGGRVAFVQKLHHALADGLAGVELATVLLDLERRPVRYHAARPWHPRPVHGPVRELARDAVRRGTLAVRFGVGALGALADPVGAVRRTAALVEGLATYATPRTVAPPTSLNVPVNAGRRFAVVRQPLGPLRGVEERFGVTLNDVVLAAVAGGLRTQLAARGEALDGRELRVMVPVGEDHHGDHRLGNRVSALLVALPLGGDDPVARLRAVSDDVRAHKARHQALAGARLLDLAEALPPVVLAAVSPLVHRQRLCNVVVTNVPGPSVPLFALGARLLEVFPVVPLAGNLSVGVAVFSYDGQLTLGILADRDRGGDVQVLAAGIGRAFEAMVEAARRPERTRSPGGAAARTRTGHVTGHATEDDRAVAATCAAGS